MIDRDMTKESPRSVIVSALRIRQPIGDIYVGSIPAKTLVEITDFDIRSLVTERGIDSYMGVQRELDQKRVREIAQYVRGPDATFPTSVVLAIPEKCVSIESPCEVDDRFVQMTLSNYPRVEDEQDEAVLFRHIARVIDGQHRIKGLEGYEGADFDVNVSIFIDIDIADQASVFATVNLAQTKVSKSLAYDLFAFSNDRSPEKTCHSVVVTLESSEGSPFFRKIKRLGKATPGRYTETLSQATVVAGVLQYICKDRLQVISDRQIGRRGGKFPPAAPKDADRLVLRPFFVENSDVELTNLLWNYFEAVQSKWPAAWASNGTGMMLNRTNGFNGLMKFFRHAYRHFAAPGQMVTSGQFAGLFSNIKLTDSDFNPQRFVPGSSGATALSQVLLEQSGIPGTYR
jgi:DGQHR domain-containing protein